ncbi:MAG: PepSY-like domain-containing protein [Bacteroidales bacterium]|nr:PepSY-like domain-containing protein [Bacteroidales bacterium]
MKKLMIICAAIASLTTMAFCTKTDNNPKIESFVNTYFPQATIAATVPDGREFDVMLSDNTKLEFDRKVEWKEIDCEHSTIYTFVPSALVPQQITDYVSQKYPENTTIVKISKDGRNWDIELNNDIEIEFNKNFEVIDIDF